MSQGLNRRQQGDTVYLHYFYVKISVTSFTLPEVCAEVKAGSKRPVTDNRGASACGKQGDSVCLTVQDGYFQFVHEGKRVLQVCHYPELQLALWWHLPHTGLNAPKGLSSAFLWKQKHTIRVPLCHESEVFATT